MLGTGSGVSIPAVRVRYMLKRPVFIRSKYCFNSRSAGKIHWGQARNAGCPRPVSIPAVRVRYIVGRFPVRFDSGVSIPAVRVRYIIMRFVMCLILDSFNSRSAGKIHYIRPIDFTFQPNVSIPAVRVRYISKNNENAQKNLQYNLCNFLSLLFYYSESLKLCLPFAQKSKKIFPVFIFSPVRGPVL